MTLRIAMSSHYDRPLSAHQPIHAASVNGDKATPDDGSFVRIAVIRRQTMLRDVRMAALVKLHWGGIDRDQCPVWADAVEKLEESALSFFRRNPVHRIGWPCSNAEGS